MSVAPSLLTAEEHAEALRRLEEAEDAEFNYERYRDHAVKDVDIRTMPLFMDAREVRGKLNDDDDTESTCVDLEALKHIEDDFDPEHEAEDLKRQGNQAFSMGYTYRVAALKLFTKAIKLPVNDDAKRSVYFANRAAVNLLGENYGNCISDCKHAVRLDPSNVKAYYRAAKASYALRKWRDAAEFVELGLKVDAANAPLLEIRAQAATMIEKQRAIDAEAAKRSEAARAKQNTITARLFAMLKANGLKIGSPNATVPLSEAFTSDPSSGDLSCRVIFLYDEHAQSDTVQAMPLASTFAEQLENMFPPTGPVAPWDKERKYSLERLELYAVLNQTTQLTYDTDKQSIVRLPRTGKPKWSRVDLKTTLHKLIKRDDYIVPGVVTLYCVVRDSVHAKKLLELDPEDMA
jgi:tetratricopeptide (TPR) repeat protein